MAKKARGGVLLTRNQGSPSFRDRPPLGLAENVPTPALQSRLLSPVNSFLRCYTLGECPVVVTKEYGRWHLSISHARRYPTWDEIAEARYRLLPKAIHAALVLPPASEYINIHENCFQVHEIDFPPAPVY